MGNAALLEAALHYAEQGMFVFPARLYVRGNNKKGAYFVDDWDASSTNDPETIRGWWGEGGSWTGAVVCIDTGKSGLVVIDQDISDGKQGPAEWARIGQRSEIRVRTGSGGWHDYFRADPEHLITVANRGEVADGVDVRGSGGLVFAPPSVDPRGGQWEWEAGMPDFSDLPDLPAVVIERMAAAQAAKRPKPDQKPREGAGRFMNGGDYSGANTKSHPEADALLTREITAFMALTEVGSGRSHILAQSLAVLAGHGVGVFWSYDHALSTLLDACDENGFTAEHGRGYAEGQAANGLRYGMQDPWIPVDRSSGPDPSGTTGDEPAEDSWAPVDVTAVLNGEHRQVVPELGRRSDGIRILYPGKEHAIASEPECGKTWWVMLQVKSVLEEGGCVVYIDFEDDEGTIVGRLMSLGIDHGLLKPDRFRYVRPDVRPPAGVVARLCTFGDDFAQLVILDGMTEGLGLMNLSALEQEAIVEWRKTFVKPAMRLGAATLTTDHVVKAADNRGRYAIGAQHKLAGLNGVMFTMTAYKPFGQGLDGISTVWITKDRNGGLRRQGKQAEGITEIGALHGECSSGRNEWSFRPPFERATAAGVVERYPGLDKKFHSFVKPVLEYIRANQNHSYTTIRENVKGSNAAIGTVLRWLTDKQALATQSGQGGGRLYALDTFVASTLDVEAAVLDGIRSGLFPTD